METQKTKISLITKYNKMSMLLTVTLTGQLKFSIYSICWILKYKQGMFCWNSMKEDKPIWLGLLEIAFSRCTLF